MNKTIFEQFKNLLIKVLKELGVEDNNPQIELNKNGIKGHFSTTVALANGKKVGMKPTDLAEKIKEKLEKNKDIKEVEVAGPGFINITLEEEFISTVISNVEKEGKNYGRGDKKNYKINLEEVSANPTGYLHVGHARNAVIGDSLVRILSFNGYDVQSEYYINDAGNQINVLAVTVFVNYLNQLGIEAELPENSYKGEGYDIVANKLIEEYGDQFKDIKFNDTKIEDPEVHEIFRKKATHYFLEIIKDQLEELDVEIEHWSSEQKMYDDNEIPKMLDEYRKKDAIYESEGAVFLKTTTFNDDKDRVLVKSNGDYTYLTPDLATHNIRIARTKADKLINIWGGDHHGYITRMRAGLAWMGNNPDILEIEMVQMVRVIKDGKEYKMSKRKGTAVWLVDLLEMVGKDALRYMLASKSSSSHMDLDLDLVKQKNASNPVYYAQYATARLNSILKQAKDKGIKANTKPNNLLKEDKETELLITLDNFSEIVNLAAKNRAPHVITDYIQVVAKQFHSYYSEFKIIDSENNELSAARLGLINSVLQVLTNAFGLIGINVLEEM